MAASFTIYSANVVVGNDSFSTHAFKSLASNTLTIGPRDDVNGTIAFLADVGVRTLEPASALHVAGNVTIDDSLLITGNVGVGTTSPTYNLHVVGNIYATQDVIAFSDQSVKGNVRHITHALSKVGMLNGYTFDRTDVATGRRYAGLLAQEVVGVMDECVYSNPNGTLALAYPNMCALLIEAVKELHIQVEELRNIVKTIQLSDAN